MDERLARETLPLLLNKQLCIMSYTNKIILEHLEHLDDNEKVVLTLAIKESTELISETLSVNERMPVAYSQKELPVLINALEHNLSILLNYVKALKTRSLG